MNLLKILCITLAGCMASTSACASSVDWGYISGILPTSNGAVLFNTSGTRSAPPACQGTGLAARFSLDGSTQAGQAQIAILLNAYNTHKKITIVGKNACTIWGDTETVEYFLMAD